MGRRLLILLVLIAVMFGVSFAESVKVPVYQDAKGSYILNDLGSKGRISAKDLELKNQGLPYGITLDESDMSAQEVDKRAQDKIVNDAKQAEIKAEQEKEALIQAKVRENAIVDLQDEGKLNAEGKLTVEEK